MTETTARIRWRDDDGGFAGTAGTAKTLAFTIWPPGEDGEWLLVIFFTGSSGSCVAFQEPAASPDDLKRAAETWLAEHVASLGAVFPPESPPTKRASRTAGAERREPPRGIQGFARANAERTSRAGHRDAERGRRALEVLGDRCSDRMRAVAEARIVRPEASWNEIGTDLGMTKDQAAGLFGRLMHRLHVAQLREKE